MKNKKILIVALFLLLFICMSFIFALNNRCYASIDKNYSDVSSNMKEYINSIMKDNPDYKYFISSGENCTYFIKDSDVKFSVLNYKGISSSKSVVWYSYKYPDTQPNWNGSLGYPRYHSYFVDSSSNQLYSNTIIYADNDFNEVLFQQAPQGIVAQQVEEIQLSQALQEVIAILPMTLAVLVSLVGLRKGLKMLETFLHQS